ncbi:MAG: MFS transporter, partial [Candidatus Binatia bacterium]
IEHVANRTFVFILVLTFYVFAVRAGLRANLIPLFGQEAGGLSESAIGFILSASAFSNFAVLWHAGSLIDRRGRMWVAMPSLVATGAISAAFAISPAFWSLLVMSVFFGAALGYLAPAPAAMAADLTPRELMGSMMGIYRMGGDLGLLLGPVGVGFVAERLGFEAAYIAAGLFALVVLGLGVGLPETLGGRRRAEPAIEAAARIDASDAGR